jgi:uncharacterized protein (DUF488 family)
MLPAESPRLPFDREVNGMPKCRLFTTGYSGHDVTSFIELLQDHDISVVIDVRRNPISRKKGFSSKALTQHLQKSDIDYVHTRELGVPQELRNALRDGTCELSEYLDQFRTYVDGLPDALDSLYALAKKKKCCLLCVEECPEECHRSVVADAVAARNGKTLEVVHVCRPNGSNAKPSSS